MNDIFTSHLNGLPDWDMFQSALPPYSGFHAASRCISGGPVYITDTPGQHDLDLIKQISALSPQGHTIALRPGLVALPLDPFIGFNKNLLLKLGNFSGSRGGDSLLAVFNVSEKQNSEMLCADDFPGLVPGERYAIHSHATGTVHKLHVQGSGSLILVTLPQYGWEVYTAVRVQEIKLRDASEPFLLGILGLVSAMSGVSAILSRSITVDADYVTVKVSLKALGTLGIIPDFLP